MTFYEWFLFDHSLWKLTSKCACTSRVYRRIKTSTTSHTDYYSAILPSNCNRQWCAECPLSYYFSRLENDFCLSINGSEFYRTIQRKNVKYVLVLCNHQYLLFSNDLIELDDDAVWRYIGRRRATRAFVTVNF